MSAVQSYIRETAARGRETERIGPFLATFTPTSTNQFLNYAIPDDGARPSASDVDGLTAAFDRRGRLPRLEFLTEAAPEVEKAVRAKGYTLERRVPLMICPPGSAVPPPMPDGIEVRTPASDAEFTAMLQAQNEAYGEAGPVTDADVERARDLLRRGGLAALARDIATGEPVGGGIGTALVGGSTELAGVGVRAGYRRRGIAAAITAFLTDAAHKRGGHTVFLTPDGEPEERIYARIGYRPAGEFVHLSRA